MKVYLTRRYRFSASHRLHAEAFSAERNRDIFGKCNNPFGHGHNYWVAVTFSGPVDASTGMVTNLGDLDAFAGERLLNEFDHTNLNIHARFRALVPTTENLSLVMHEIFSAYPNAHLEWVHVEETSNNSFEYGGDSLRPADVRKVTEWT